MRNAIFTWLFIFSIALSSSGLAETNGNQAIAKGETITNEEILTMVKAKLGDTIIINKIKTSKTDFNTSTDALVKLKQSGVSDNVIDAMMGGGLGEGKADTTNSKNIGAAEAVARQGLSFGLGLGAMVPADEYSYGDEADFSYMGIEADFYPELQIAYDIHAVKIGLSAGYINKDSYGYQLSFVPVELSVSVLPVLFSRQDAVLQPYVGIGAGKLIATGDNKDSYWTVSPHLGVEFQIGHKNILGIDFSYHIVDEDMEWRDYNNLDYYTAMLVYRFRVPFERH